jgi:hypothetical protein
LPKLALPGRVGAIVADLVLCEFGFPCDRVAAEDVAAALEDGSGALPFTRTWDRKTVNGRGFLWLGLSGRLQSRHR